MFKVKSSIIKLLFSRQFLKTHPVGGAKQVWFRIPPCCAPGHRADVNVESVVSQCNGSRLYMGKIVMSLFSMLRNVGSLEIGTLHYGKERGTRPTLGWSSFLAILGHFKGFLDVTWTERLLEAYAQPSYPRGRTLKPKRLLSKPTRDVADDVRLGSHSALGCNIKVFVDYVITMCHPNHPESGVRGMEWEKGKEKRQMLVARLIKWIILHWMNLQTKVNQ